MKGDMVKGKIKFNHQLWRQLGLFTVYVLTQLMSPFYIYQKIGENDSARFTIFLGEHSLYNAKEFEGLLNSYFTISLVILFVLPVLAIFLKYLLDKTGYPLLAHLQSLLIFVACSIILIFTMFIGRVGPLSFGLSILKRKSKGDSIYPEGRMLIG